MKNDRRKIRGDWMKRIIWLLLLATILIGGCISIEFEQKVDENGDCRITERIDISSLVSMAAAKGNVSMPTEEEVCANYTKEGYECSYDDGVITIAKDFKLSEADFYSFEREDSLFETTYTLTVTQMPKMGKEPTMFNQTGQPKIDTSLTAPEAKGVASMMKTMNINITYTVKMPSPVVDAEGAVRISGNTATFDVLERMENQRNIVVIAKGYNAALFVGIGVIAAVVIVILLGLWINKKRTK